MISTHSVNKNAQARITTVCNATVRNATVCNNTVCPAIECQAKARNVRRRKHNNEHGDGRNDEGNKDGEFEELMSPQRRLNKTSMTALCLTSTMAPTSNMSYGGTSIGVQTLMSNRLITSFSNLLPAIGAGYEKKGRDKDRKNLNA